MKFRNIMITTVAAAAALFTAAAPAMAGTAGHHHPTPTPTINPLHLSPEQFDIVLANDVGGTNVNAVNAEGPLAIRAGTDTTINNILDHFNSGPNRVNVLHAGLPAADVDLRTCTVRYTLTDAPWRFAGGTGLFSRARGFGVFDLNAEFSFAAPRGHCLLNGLSLRQINREVQLGGNRRILASDVFVQGSGVASIGRRNIFTPTTAPTV